MAKSKSSVLPSICMYGNSSIGAGWLASHNGQMFGDGEPKHGRSFSEAVFQACDALSKAGVSGDAWVYAAGGLRKAKVSVSRPVWYGNLQWVSAEVYEVPASVIDSAEVVSNG